MKQIPSRVLNEPSNFMGLVSTDILALSGIFMVSQRLLYFIHLEIFAIFIAFIAGIFLTIIRMKFRRKIIRDAFKYYYVKIFNSGFIYVR